MKNQNNKILFPVVYETDPEGGFVAFVPSLPGCHTQGDTLEEAEQNIKEATEAYLESMEKEKDYNPHPSRFFQGVIEVSAS